MNTSKLGHFTFSILRFGHWRHSLPTNWLILIQKELNVFLDEHHQDGNDLVRYWLLSFSVANDISDVQI